MSSLALAIDLVVFSSCFRHESSESEKAQQGGLQVRVQNTKLGISTFWSLDKFQNNMAAMRELEQVGLVSVGFSDAMGMQFLTSTPLLPLNELLRFLPPACDENLVILDRF